MIEFSNKKYLRALVISCGLTNFGDGFARVVYSLLALSLGASPFEVSLVSFAQFLPALIFTIGIGVALDRWCPIKLMKLANLTRTIITILLSVLAYSGHIRIYWIVIGIFIISSMELFVDQGIFAVLPKIVKDEELAMQNGRISSIQQIANNLISKPIATLLSSFSHSFAIFTHGLSLLIGTLVLRVIPKLPLFENNSQVVQEPIFVGLGKTIKFIHQSSGIYRGLIAISIMNCCTAAVGGVFPFYIMRELGEPEWVVGLMLTGFAIGGLLGAKAFAKLNLQKMQLFSFAIILQALGFFVCGIALKMAWLFIITLILGFSSIIATLSVQLKIQMTAPTGQVGRVMSFGYFIALCLTPLAALMGGLIAEISSVKTLYLVSSIFLLIASYIGKSSKSEKNVDPSKVCGLSVN
jgi:MFS family permease